MTVTCSHHPWRAFGLELIPGNRGARGMLWWPQTSSPLARPITHELEAPASTACQSHRAPCPGHPASGWTISTLSLLNS